MVSGINTGSAHVSGIAGGGAEITGYIPLPYYPDHTSEQVLLAAVDTGITVSKLGIKQRSYLYNNVDEIEGNGIDDDNDGKVDNVTGPWTGPADNDFYVPGYAGGHGRSMANASISRIIAGQNSFPEVDLKVSYVQGPYTAWEGQSSGWFQSAWDAISYGADVISMSLGFNEAHVSSLKILAQHASRHDSLIVIRNIGKEQGDMGVFDGNDHLIELGFISDSRSYSAAEVDLISAKGQQSGGIANTAGDIAAVWGANPNLTSQQVLEAIAQTTYEYEGDVEKNSQMGGIIDRDAAIEVALTITPEKIGFLVPSIDLKNGVSVNRIGNSEEINLSAYLEKTHAVAFQTDSDINSTQVIYEQGGATRGLNLFVKDETLYSAVWNKAEENWGYKELSIAITPNTKYTATIVLNGEIPANGKAQLYLNGILVDSVDGVGQLYSHGDSVGVGAIQGSTLIHNQTSREAAFKGNIETIVQYNTVFSDNEFAKLQNNLAEEWLSAPQPGTGEGDRPTGGPGPGEDDDSMGESGVREERVIAEFGSVQANHEKVTVQLDHTFQDAVVFVTMTSFNGAEIAVPRLTDVTANSFTFYAQEANYLDGEHAAESFSYIVIEKGSWELSDGTKLEAGEISTNKLTSRGFESIGFGTSFEGERPAVFSQVQTENGGDWVVTRHDEVTSEGFKLAMQEEEALNSGSHAKEDVGWFAIEQGYGVDDGTYFFAHALDDEFTHEWKDVLFQTDELPQLLAQISSFDGPDTAAIRIDSLQNSGARIQIQEEQSKDNETRHTTETVDIFGFDGFGQLTGISTDVL